LLLALVLSSGCSPGRSFERQLHPLVKPYQFSTAAWELKAIPHQIGQWLWHRDKNTDAEADTVTEYVARGSRIKALRNDINTGKKDESFQSELDRLEKEQAAISDTVQRIMARQIGLTLAGQGIYQPGYRWVKLRVTFPPPTFKLEPLPNILVISPRDKIETMKTVLLSGDMTVSDMTALEAKVDQLNVSSLVDGLGGLGTYPAIITSDASLDFILETAAHEWIHQYLAFTPLGLRYLLHLTGVARNYDITSMNETVANMVGKEIGKMVAEKYYPQFKSKSSRPPPATRPAFDFNREMRDIRKSVDQYLAKGETESAEQFMREKRDYLASQGYHIRKLNQAYFAFHGGYGDVPAFESPIGRELKQLRAKSTSLSSFLDTAASFTSRQDLKLAVE